MNCNFIETIVILVLGSCNQSSVTDTFIALSLRADIRNTALMRVENIYNEILCPEQDK